MPRLRPRLQASGDPQVASGGRGQKTCTVLHDPSPARVLAWSWQVLRGSQDTWWGEGG